MTIQVPQRALLEVLAAISAPHGRPNPDDAGSSRHRPPWWRGPWPPRRGEWTRVELPERLAGMAFDLASAAQEGSLATAALPEDLRAHVTVQPSRAQAAFEAFGADLDQEFCGTPPRWPWPHGPALALVTAVLVEKAARHEEAGARIELVRLAERTAESAVRAISRESGVALASVSPRGVLAATSALVGHAAWSESPGATTLASTQDPTPGLPIAHAIVLLLAQGRDVAAPFVRRFIDDCGNVPHRWPHPWPPALLGIEVALELHWLAAAVPGEELRKRVDATAGEIVGGAMAAFGPVT